MSFSTSAPAYSFFPSAPSAPNAFALFASTQSPRDTYNMYEDARQSFFPSTAHIAQRKTSKSSLKKLFSLTAGSTSSFEVRVYTYWQLLPSGAVATSEEVGVGREWIPTCNALRVLEDPLKLTARRLGLQGDRG